MNLLPVVDSYESENLEKLVSRNPGETEIAFRLRVMKLLTNSLPREFDQLYLGDDAEIKKKIRALISSHQNQQTYTRLDAIIILLFFDDKISFDNFVLFLTSRDTEYLSRWLALILTDKDAFMSTAENNSRKRSITYILASKSTYIRRDLFLKGFPNAIAKVLFNRGDQVKYKNGGIYNDYIQGVALGLATNDEEYRKYSDVDKFVFPGFIQTVEKTEYIVRFLREEFSDDIAKAL